MWLHIVTGTLTFTAKAVTVPWFCRIRDWKWGFPVTSALPSLVWKGRKNNACFSGYWSRVVRIFFYKNTISVSRKKRQLNLWYPAPCWSRASYHRLLLQQSQNRRRLHTSHSHDFLIYSVWERMLTRPSQWRVLSMCGRCLGRTTPSLGLFPLKMGGAGGTPPIFWGKSPEDKVVRRKRGMQIHRRASKQERDFFLFFPALSAQPSRSLARKAMSELG